MKNVSKLAILAAASVLLVGPAYADCPSGSASYPGGVSGGWGFPWGGNLNGPAPAPLPPTDPTCATPAAIGFNGTAVSGVIVEDPNNPGEGIYQQPVSLVYGPNGTAVGAGAYVGRPIYDDNGNLVGAEPVSNGTALGAGAAVEHDNSTAVGAGAKSTDTNQVTLGTKDETIRAEGITSQKSKDRQVGPLEVVTSDSGGRLATDGGQIFSTLGTHNDQIATLESQMSGAYQAISANTALLSQHSAQLEEHAKGLAIAMAMPDAWLSDRKRFGIFGGIGGFEGETAVGFAAIGRLDETFSINAKLGADTDFDHVGWQVGVGAQW